MIAAALLLLAAASSVVSVTEVADRQGARSQVMTFEVAAPTSEVWDALTTADGWRKWAAPVAWTRSTSPLVIETSYDTAARPDGPQTIKQQFDRLEPQRSLSFRTVKAPATFAGFETYSNVVSEVSLTPLDLGRTRVRFVSGPFPDTSEGRRLYRFFLEGNRLTFERMAQVLAREPDTR